MPETLTRLICPRLLLVSGALTLSIVWDLGYTPLSLESGCGLLAGLLIGTVFSLVSGKSPRLRTMLTVLLFLCLLDVFFLHGGWLPWIVMAVGLGAACAFHKRIPVTAIAVFAAVFSAGVLFQGFSPHGARPVALPEAGSKDDALIVHLLLDELGSFDSVPPEFRRSEDIEAVRSAYAERGFVIREGVLSVSPDTYKSMSVLVNNAFLTNGKSNSERIAGKDAHAVLDNQLHRRIAARGWETTVVQSWFMDYCRDVASCFTYDMASSSEAFERISDRGIRLDILRRQVSTTIVSDKRGLILLKPIRKLVSDPGISRTGWRNPALPFVAMEQIDLLQDALVKSTGRRYVFAHILFPHFPWVYDRQCKVKPVDEWLLPYGGRANRRPGARKEALEAYWDQSVCAHHRVARLIDAVDAAHPGRVQFVVHGDHGPRILARNLATSAKEAQDEQTVRNLVSPFIATRLAADQGSNGADDASLQSLVFGLLDEATSTGAVALPAAGKSQVAVAPTRMIHADPAALAGCNASTVILKWDVRGQDPELATVKIYTGTGKLFTHSGGVGSLETGPWVKPGSVFVLKSGVDDSELERLTIGGPVCP